MKIVLSSDWHLRSDWYPNRADDGMETQRRVLEWLAGIGDVHVVAGDIFQRWYASSPFINTVIGWLQRFPSLDVIYGNHDLPANNVETRHRSALQTLELAGVVDIPMKPVQYVEFDGYLFAFEHFRTVVEPPDDDIRKRKKNVVVIHHPVFRDSVPFWSGEGLTAAEILDEYPWANIVVCGDIHTPFIYEDNGRVVINCGGLFYERPDDPQKVVWVLDTKTGEIEQIPVPDEPEWIAVETKSKKTDVSELSLAMREFQLDSFDFERMLVAEIRARGRDDLLPLLNEIKMGVTDEN